jgi:D-alanyl-lipoteichoic acid acyltransferase DltB (MBOAT superfamily)
MAVFIYLKKHIIFWFLPNLSYPFVTVGLSYILLRILQVLIDVYQGAIKERISLVDFFNFTCNFLTFVSGPIQRYQEYKEQAPFWGNKVLSEQETLRMFSRIIKGTMKTVIISGIFLNLHQYSLSGLKDAMGSGAQGVLCHKYLAVALYYTFYLYYNFTGYMDIVIGIGGLFGARIPENFNKPFESTSLLEIWTRWHMTLSEWFKFYVFNPFVGLLVRKWDNPKFIPYHSVTAYCLTFFLLGIWHGATAIFVVYGALLGLGVSMNKLFDMQMRRHAGILYKKLISNKGVRILSAGLAFSYFGIGLTSCWLNFHELFQFFIVVKVAGFLKILFVGTIIASIVILMTKIVMFFIQPIKDKCHVLLQNTYLVYALLALQIFLIVVFWFQWSRNLPEFVYKGF